MNLSSQPGDIAYLVSRHPQPPLSILTSSSAVLIFMYSSDTPLEPVFTLGTSKLSALWVSSGLNKRQQW